MARNDGLSTANFVSGAMQGYSFMQGVEDNRLRRKEVEANRGLRDATESRAQQSHAAQMQSHEQNQKINAIRFSELDEAKTQKMNKALAWSMHNATEMPEEYRSLVSTHPNLDAQRLMSDEAGKYLETLEQAATGKVDYRSPEVAEAFDFLNPEIGLGASGGRRVKTSRLVPGKTPGTIMVGLSVEGDNDVRPLTERRSADDDDPVREVPLEQLIQKAQTMKLYRQMMLDPKGREWFIKNNLPEVAGADNGGWSEIKTDEKTGVTYQRNLKTGEVKQLDPRKTVGGGKGSSGQASALEKEVEYLKSIGLPQETALDIATNSKQDPAAHIISIAKAISETGGLPIKDAIDQAKSVYEEKLGRKLTKPEAKKIEGAQLASQINQISLGGKAPTETKIPMRRPQQQAPSAAIEYLKANPDSAEFFKQKYGYLPE